MADSITYTVGSSSLTLNYPVLTVTQIPVLGGRGDFVAFVRKVFTVRCIVTDTGGVTLDEAIKFYHEILSCPGGQLEINYGSWADELTVEPTEDLRAGPRPVLLHVTKIYGGKAALVEWQVETERFPTDAGYFGEEGKWVDLVYTIQTALDQNFYATRTVSGILRINRSYPGSEDYQVDAFRDTITSYFPVPPVTRGYWQRITEEFKSNEADNTLTFRIVDKQTYAWLPDGITSGDMAVTTEYEKIGRGTIALRGWFESHEWQARSYQHTAILDILALFYNNVVTVISAETLGRFHLTEDRNVFTHHWRKNRVDFNVVWTIEGTFETGLVDNIEYTTGVVLDWLGLLTRTRSSSPPELGPYGTSGSSGRRGDEVLAPAIDIDFEAKIAAHRTFSLRDLGSRTLPHVPGGATAVTRGSEYSGPVNLSFRQQFSYKIDQGLRTIPVLQANVNDIVQQVKNPEVYLIVVGEIVTGMAPPPVPLPPFPLVGTSYVGGDVKDINSPKAILLKADVRPERPTGTGEYKLSWHYLLKLVNINIPVNLESGMALRWPWTPRWPVADWETDGYRSWDDWTFP